MERKLLLSALIGITLHFASFSIVATPNWYVTNTGANHTILIQNTSSLLIDGVQIEIGDYIGVFYDSLGTLACGGFIEWTGSTATLSAWGSETGVVNGFAANEEFKWKIWDASSLEAYDALATYLPVPPMSNQETYVINGMSGLESLSATAGTSSAPPWTYTLTSGNHTILIQNTIPITIDGIQIEAGDYLGVFYDSLGYSACAGFVEWTGSMTTVAAWGEDLGNDGFATGEEFKWKIWDSSEELEIEAIATYISGYASMGNFMVNGISALASLTAQSLSTPDWNYSITSSNHTILIQSNTPMTIYGQSIEIGDYIGVFYDSLGTLACAGYIEWNGTSNTIAAWGADVGNDGFATGEEFKWKVFDASQNMEYPAEASYQGGGVFPNGGSFLGNGISGLASLTAPVLIPTNPGWYVTNTGANHSVLIPGTLIADIDGELIQLGDYIGAFYDSLGTLACAGYIMWEGNQTALPVWGTEQGTPNGFAWGEQFKWIIWDANTGNQYLADATYNLVGMPNDSTYATNGLSSLATLSVNSKSIAVNGLVSACNFSTNEVISVQITNNNIFASSGFSVSYKINNGPEISETVFQSVDPDSTIIYNFSQTANLSATGIYSIEVWTSIYNHVIVNIENYPLPQISFSGLNSQYCENASSSILIGLPANGFFTGPGINGNLFDPALSGDGLHTVSYTYTDANGCSNTSDQTVVVFPTADPDFIVQNACLGDISTISNLTSLSVPVNSFQWTFGDGNTATIFEPQHIYSNPGVFTINLSVTTNNNCISSVSYPATVYAKPTVQFTANNGCFGDTNIFINNSISGQSSITQWHWTFGDGLNSNLENPTHYYSQAGLYNVSLFAEDANTCSDSHIITIEVFELPSIEIQSDTVCLGELSTLNGIGNSNIMAWIWNLGDNNNAYTQSVQHEYQNPGTFNIEVTVWDINSCSNTAYGNALVNAPPSADIGSNNICEGQTSFFTDLSVQGNSAIIDWIWNFGDGNNSSDQNPTYLYSQSGVYSVSLEVTDQNNCSDNVVSQIEVYSLPQVLISGLSQQYCSNSPSELVIATPSNGILSGNGIVNNYFNPVIAGSGIHEISYIFTDLNGCTNSDTVLTTVFNSPQAQFSANDICFGQLSVFTDLSIVGDNSINSWEWDFGNGSSSQDQNPSTFFTQSGFFNVQLIVGDNNGCYDTTVNTTTIFTPPFASFNFENTCLNDTTVFTDISVSGDAPIISWGYDFGDGQISNIQNPEYLYMNSGSYMVTLIVYDGNGCSNTAQSSVLINELPDFSFSATTACLGDPTSFVEVYNGTAGIQYYNWDFGDGNTSNISSPVNTYASEGDYVVSLDITDNNGCSANYADLVAVLPLPVVDLGNDIAIGLNETAVLDAGIFDQYLWNTGHTSQTIDVTSSGFFQVTVTNSFGCSNFSNTKEVYKAPWMRPNTGANHSILIPDFITINIDTVPIQTGDLIGVFYDSLGVLACGGFIRWEGQTTALAAWGADVGNDGFTSGEVFNWKILDVSDNIEYLASANYDTLQFPNNNTYVTNGLSGLTELQAVTVETQTIVLPSGWSMFSTYVIPDDLSIETNLQTIVQDIVIVKDEMGMMYWPTFSVNLIGDLSITEGYQIKMLNTAAFDISGTKADPLTTGIDLYSGWNLFSYIRSNPAPIDQMLSSIVADISIVKNGNGLMFWPLFSINLIGNMNPGEGYQVQMNNTNTLYYPANSQNYKSCTIAPYKTNYYKEALNTGHNMSICIPVIAWENVPEINSEIAVVFNKQIIGTTVFDGKNTAITVWGDDPTTDKLEGISEDNSFEFEFYSNGKTGEIFIESWTIGDNIYETNKIAVAEKASFVFNSEEFMILSNTPNPFSDKTDIQFSIPEAGTVNLTVFDPLGKLIQQQDFDFGFEGKKNITINLDKAPNGIYFYQLKYKEQIVSSSMQKLD